MPIYTGTFSARSRYQLQLHISPRAGDQAGNFTDVDWGLYIVETTENGSYSGAPATWSATIDGQTWNGASPYDFRSSNSLWLGGGTKRVYHNADGTKSFYASSSVGGGTTIGSASAAGTTSLTRIPKVPGAPLISGTVNGTVLGPQEPITTSSILVKFSGTSDGGSAITGWELQAATDPSFTTNVQTISSSGTTTVTGLAAGKVHYFRARGRNGVGWGPYSATASATTRTAVYVSDGTTWHSAEIYVSDGSAWRVPELLISDGTTWREPASI